MCPNFGAFCSVLYMDRNIHCLKWHYLKVILNLDEIYRDETSRDEPSWYEFMFGERTNLKYGKR